jgi:VWFA-related protein
MATIHPVAGGRLKNGRAASASAVIAVGLLSSPGFGQEPAAVPSFPAQANAITADVVVLDKGGRPVRGLTREDFTLLADGKPQTIVGFEARELGTTAASPATTVGDERVATNEGGAKGRALVFLIDDLAGDARNLAKRHHELHEAKKTIERWLREKAQPADELTLATVSGAQMWSDRIDRGRADFLAVLDRIGIHLAWERINAGPAYALESSRGSTGARGRPGEAPGAGGGDDGGSSGGASSPDLLSGLGQRIAARTEGGPTEQELYDSLRRRTAGLLENTVWLSRSLAGVRGRKSIVIFSDGIPNDPNNLQLFDRAVDASQRANTAVYFVDVKGLGVPERSRAQDRNGFTARSDGSPEPWDLDLGARSMYLDYFATAGLEMVAENTGGATVRDTNDLLGGVERIAEESSTYYLLGYQPDKAPDGNWHKLEVKVGRPGLKARTRRGYQAPPPPTVALAPPVKNKKEKKDAKEKGPRRQLDPAVMTSGAGDAIPLRLASYVLDADKAGLARVLVVVELDTSRLTFQHGGMRQTGAVDLTVIGMSRDSGRMFPLDERVQVDVGAKAAGGWMSLTRELRLPAGVAQVRALVRDVASGLGGTVTQRLEVPALDGPYMATPVVTDQLVMVPGKGPRLVPVAYRRFRPRGLLYCSYEVMGMTNARGEATTHVTGGFTLRDSAGQIVRQSSPTPIAIALFGKVIRMLALPLAGLEAGEYDLVLDVFDESSGRILQSREPFVLASS